jgi:hypothetical protein
MVCQLQELYLCKFIFRLISEQLFTNLVMRRSNRFIFQHRKHYSTHGMRSLVLATILITMVTALGSVGYMKQSTKMEHVCARGSGSATVTCPRPLDVIYRVAFASASYGITGGCGAFNESACPSSASDAAKAYALCEGQQSCTVSAVQLPDWCAGKVTHGGPRTVTLEVVCNGPSQPFAFLPEVYEYFVTPPVEPGKTLQITPSSSCAVFTPPQWSFSAATDLVAVSVVFLATGTCDIKYTNGGTAAADYSPLLSFGSAVQVCVEIMFSLPQSAAFEPKGYLLEVGQSLNLEVSVGMPASLQLEDLNINLIFLGDDGSLTMPAQASIPPGSNRTTVVIRGEAISSPGSLAAEASGLVPMLSLLEVTIVIWGRVPVFSMFLPSDGTYLRTLSKADAQARGYREVCSATPYDGPQDFCVNASDTEAEINAQPFYLLSGNLPEVTAQRWNLTAVYSCGFSVSGCGATQQFLSLSSSCLGHAKLSGAPLGFAASRRTEIFSSVLWECAPSQSSCSRRRYNVFDDSTCGAVRGVTPGAQSVAFQRTPVVHVIPLQSERTRCRSVWCTSGNVCIDDALVCNGAKDCPGAAAEDEDPEMCCRRGGGLYCSQDSRCLPAAKICDGTVDCPASGGLDEDHVKCYSWPVIEHNAVMPPAPLAPSSFTSPLGRMSLLHCIRLARTAAAVMLAFAANGTECLLYSVADGQLFLAASAFQLQTQPGYSLRANIRSLAQGVDIANCQHGYACSGHGQLWPGSCQCSCSDGYYGDNCQFSLNLMDWKIVVSGTVPQTENRQVMYGMLKAVKDALKLVLNYPGSSLEASATSFDANRTSFYSVLTLQGSSAEERTALYTLVMNETFLPALRRIPTFNDDIRLGPAGGFDTLTSASIVGSGPVLNSVNGYCQTVAGFQKDCAFAAVRASRITLSVVYSVNATPLSFPVLIYTLDRPSTPYVFECERQSLPSGHWNGLWWCEISSCILNVSHLGPVVRLVTQFPNDDLECFSLALPSLAPVIPSSPLVAAAVRNSAADFSGWLAGGIVLLVVASVLLAGSFFFLRRDHLLFSGNLEDIRDRTAEELIVTTAEEDCSSGEPQLSPSEAVLNLLQLSISSILFYRVDRNALHKALGVFLVVMFINVAIVGALFVIVYALSSGFDSSHAVLLERLYASDQFPLSSQTLPYAAVEIHAADGQQCRRRQVIGYSSDVNYFLSAYCNNNANGQSQVVIRSARTVADCEAAPFLTYVSGAVLPASSVFSEDPPLPLVRLSCGLAASVRARAENLSHMLGVAPVRGEGDFPEAVAIERRQHWDNPLLLAGGTFSYPRIQSQRSSHSTSVHPCRFESAHRHTDRLSLVSTSSSTLSLVVMTSDSLSETPSRLSEVAELQSRYASSLAELPADVLALGPRDGDLPVGFLHDMALLRDSSRYYGVRGSYADIGRYFGPRMRVSDGEGVTISLYLLASATSTGFAFAVTDAVDDLAGGRSPLLDHAADMMRHSSPGSAWLETALNIYCGLFVDGPGRALHLILANSPHGNSKPAPANPFLKLTWNLDQLGLLRLLNGMWHHVVVIVRSENSQTKAQLIVDGSTSRMKPGWNLCMERRPEGIIALDASKRLVGVASDDSYEERHLSGLLVSGYFNGGVSKIEFTPSVKDLFSIWAESTETVRTFNALNTDKYIILGSLLIAAGAIFFATMWITSGREILESRREAKVAKKLQSFNQYRSLWLRQPVDSDDIAFAPVPLGAAKAWLSLDDDEMSVFLEELVENERLPENELVRLLYIFCAPPPHDLSVSLPTSSAWGAAVATALQEAVLEDDPLEASDDVHKGTSAAEARERADVAIDAGKLQFATTQQNASQSGDASGGDSARDGVKQLLLPAVAVLQSVYVWFSTIGVGEFYRKYFASFFSIICADVTSAIASVPEIVTPLLQLLIGVIVVSLLYYLLHKDEQIFLAYTGRYTLRRDMLEHQQHQDRSEPPASNALKHLRREVADSALRAEAPQLSRFAVHVLSVKDAAGVDGLMADTTTDDGDTAEMKSASKEAVGCGQAENQDEHRNDTVPCGSPNSISALSCRSVVVTLPSGCAGTVVCKPLTDPMSKKVVAAPFLTGSDLTEQPERPLSQLGCRCIVHSDRRLSSRVQNDVWPFENRAECCVVSNGRPCGRTVGTMFVCRAREGESAVLSLPVSEQVRCSFALCERHFRGTALDRVLADLLRTPRSIATMGRAWVLTTVFLFLCNLCYMPFLKTALMILACHPYFQCLFPGCWTSGGRDFVLGAFLSVFVVVFFGVGFPVILSLVLYRRSRLIGNAFFAEEYSGRYGEGPSTVSLSEWLRFSTTDPSALGEMYKSFELKWIYVPPLLLAWKVILLAPAVFLELGSFEQHVGVAVAEFAYGMFLFITEPAIPPMVDLMYKVGATHQMVFLGLQAFDTHMRYHGRGSLTSGMVALTFAYLVLCFCCMTWGKIAPGIHAALRQHRITEFLARVGMHSSSSTGLFVVFHQQMGADAEISQGAHLAPDTGSKQQRGTVSGRLQLPPASFSLTACELTESTVSPRVVEEV